VARIAGVDLPKNTFRNRSYLYIGGVQQREILEKAKVDRENESAI
jgi:hypothetical protein